MTRLLQRIVTLDSPVPDIESKNFYQIPSSMAMKAIRAKLTAADWSLWSYLQMIDPFGDYMVELPQIVEIAEVIGVSERQVRRSLKKLGDLELYRWEPVVVRGQNLAGKLVRELCQNKKTDAMSPKIKNSSGQIKMTDLSKGGQNCPSDDEIVQTVTKLSVQGQNCQNREPEPLPYKASTTSYTYSSFKNTLSDQEKNDFLDFCSKEVQNYPTKIIHLESWLASIDKTTGVKRWEEFYARYQSTSTARSQQEVEQQRERNAWERRQEKIRRKKESASLKHQASVQQQKPVVENHVESSNPGESHQIEDSNATTEITKQKNQEIKDTESQSNQTYPQEPQAITSSECKHLKSEDSLDNDCSKQYSCLKNASVRTSYDTKKRRNSYSDELPKSA